MKLKNERLNVNSLEKNCKKCGEPLRSTSKYTYCENCRRERAITRKNIVGLCLVGLSLIPGIKHFVNKK